MLLFLFILLDLARQVLYKILKNVQKQKNNIIKKSLHLNFR